MAIDVDGRLYGWGVSYCSGAGALKPVTLPSLVELIPPVDASAGDAADDIALRDEAGHAIDERVVDVSCGGGFTVCVTRSGHVYSWGTWAHGRLGEHLLLCS
jgi:alpha-tubulin suppressor-like RCC1 family protein